MGAIPPAAEDLRAEVAGLRQVVEELVKKHNFLLDDADDAFVKVEAGIVLHD